MSNLKTRLEATRKSIDRILGDFYQFSYKAGALNDETGLTETANKAEQDLLSLFADLLNKVEQLEEVVEAAKKVIELEEDVKSLQFHPDTDIFLSAKRNLHQVKKQYEKAKLDGEK